MTAANASIFSTRLLRAIAAFLVLLTVIVFVPGSPDADAASDELWIAVSVDNAAITHGAISSWTLTIDTAADITLASGITVTDTLPDGLCPLGAGDPDCAGGPAPSPAYSAATENTDGSWTLVWNLPAMNAAEQTVITYSTQARTYYQESYADDAPVLARDSWINTAFVTGDVDGSSVADGSTVSQSAGGVTVAVDAATRPTLLTQPAVCGDGAAMTWNPTQALGYRVGDQVCWRLTIDYPVDLTTHGSVSGDALPAGQAFTANDTWAPGAGNTVPLADIDGSTNTPGATSLTWAIGDSGGYVTSGRRFEVVFSTTIVDPAATWSGQNVTSVMNHSHLTSTGGSVGASDTAGVSVLEPEIRLVKGVIEVNGVSTGGSSNVDGAEVSEADVVTYQLSVANNGDIDAADVEVWDLLPDILSPCTSNISSVDAGGVCVDGSNRIHWSGAATLSVLAGGTTTASYDATIPPGIAPAEILNNEAGIVGFSSITNNGAGTFAYVPESNIDPGATGQNTTAAEDTSWVVTSAASISGSRTTSVSEVGNHADSQATIGELITYTINVTVPEGSTVYDAALVDDLPANLDLISSSHTFDGEQAVVLTDDHGIDSVTVEFPDPFYRNAAGTGDDELSVTIIARVLDIPANLRNTSIANSAVFTWHDDQSEPSNLTLSRNTTVVEPLLSVSKSSIDSIGDNGIVVGDEIVDYTIVVVNSGSSSVGTAHDVVVVDTLPEGVTPTLPIPDSGVWAVDGTPGDAVGGTITWTIAALDAGSSVTRTYQITVDDPVVVSSVFVNNVRVDSSSLLGSPAWERTSGAGYHAFAGHILNTPLASLLRSLSPSQATVGDVVTYTLEVTMPPGTIMYDATVIDTLPAGMAFDRLVSSSCDMAGSTCDPMITATEIGVPGSTTAAFFLGDIDVSSSTGEPRTVSIDFEAHFLDVGSPGDTRTSSASVYGNQVDRIIGNPVTPPDPAGFDVLVGPSADTVTLAEPRLAVDKDIAGQSGDLDYRRAVPGELLTFTIRATNSSSANISSAYDVVIVDNVPEGLNVSLPIPGGGVWVADGTPGDGIGGTITWTEIGPLARGGSLVHTYEATVEPTLDSDDEVPVGAEEVNTADVSSYFGVSGANRTANPTFVFREYDDVTQDSVSVELDLASIYSVVWFDVDADGVREPGEPLFAAIDIAVNYLGSDGVLSGDDEMHVVTTATDGSALAADLPGGTYLVTVDATDLPAGFTPSYDLDDGTLAPDGRWGAGPLGEAEDKTGVDFGYTGTGSAAGTVWFDDDADGVVGGDEYGLEGIELSVIWLGLDGVAGGDDVPYSTTTDSAGRYTVERLPAGEYTIDVTPSTLPTGMRATFDADGAGTADTIAISLSSGQDLLDQDFGYAGNGAFGDRVWLDSDGDGGQDAGEPGLLGVPIQLTWPGEDGSLGGGDDEPFVTITAADGQYFIPNMPPGEYTLEVLGGLPGAATSTYDEDGGGDAAITVGLADLEYHLTADFGFQGGASIGDTVWWDRNGDGSLDAGEAGISGVAVELTFAGLDGVIGNSDDLAFATVTDSGGGFLFTDLPAGDYEIAIAGNLPAGMVQTYDEDGGLDGRSLVSDLAVDQIHLTADFGFNGTSAVGDLVWLDIDGDGVLDIAEPGIPAVTVELTWHGGDGLAATADDVTLTTETDVDGLYSFTDLPGGGYEVAVDPTSLPAGLAQTYDADGLASSHRSTLSLSGGFTNETQDFGYDGGSSIGDTVWFDRDGNGAFDSDEYGIPGAAVDVIWAGPDSVHATIDDETFNVVTDGNGSYTISNLPPGPYAVVIDELSLPGGMAQTHDEDGVLDSQTLFALTDGQDHDSADFGYRGSGEIGDLVWFDRNGDGIFDTGEPGIPLQRVELASVGADGLLGTADDEVYVTDTDAVGSYLFTSLPPGDYAVEVVGVITTHATNTADEDGDVDSHTLVTLGDGVAHTGADFGYRGSAQIGDLVWLDLDDDGVATAGEPGVPGAEVTVTWLGEDADVGGGDDVIVAIAASDATGGYLAEGLPSGDLAVAVTSGIPAGLDNSVDPDGNPDEATLISGLASGGADLSVDFGYASPGAISGLVWWDLNNDEMADSSEPGMDAVSVAATWAGFDDLMATADDVSFATTTDNAGGYLFSGLPPGLFEIVVATDGLPAGVSQSADPDVVLDATSSVVIDPYGEVAEQDFGFRGDNSASVVAWHDVDSDGVHGAAEPGIADVTFSILFLGVDGSRGGDDDVEFVAMTLAGGGLTVAGLPSGQFEVLADAATLPEGLRFSADSDGGDPESTLIVLGSESPADEVEFLAVGDSTLDGMVWNDRDGNELIDTDEVGVGGVALTVIWSHAAGDFSIPVVTDAFGQWSVAGLPSGLYEVEIDLATVPLGMEPTTGTRWPTVLGAGDTDTLDFGIALMLDIGSAIWIDSNDDGVVDEGESGIPNVTVNLYNEVGLLVAIAESDLDGSYMFDGLYPGVYTVAIAGESIPANLQPSSDRDGDLDLVTVIDLTGGNHALDANFGFQVSDQLPLTGFEVEHLLVLGLVFLLFGAALVTGSRTRLWGAITR